MSQRLAPAWLVVGTDTEVGKTWVSCALLQRLAQHYPRVVGAKPIAAGLEADGSNDDVRRLRAQSTLRVAPELDNPYALRTPASPHLAAAIDGVVIDLDRIAAAVQTLRGQADAVLVEGVGGLLVPLGGRLDGGDLAQRLQLPLILVVGLRLGCLNHALLSAEAIAARGLQLAGWVGNAIDPHFSQRDANVDYLQSRLDAPCLGLLAHAAAAEPGQFAAGLRLPPGQP